MGNEYETTITGEDNLHNKITAIKNMAKSYEMRLKGFKWDITNNSWIPNNTALVGKNFIDLTVGILTSFCESANLLTTKDEESFAIQYADAFYKVNVLALNDETLRDNKYRSVIKMFKDTLRNIGDILIGSREIMQMSFSNGEQQEQQTEGDF